MLGVFIFNNVLAISSISLLLSAFGGVLFALALSFDASLSDSFAAEELFAVLVEVGLGDDAL